MTSHSALRTRPSRTLSIGLASALTLGALGFVVPTAEAADPVAAPALRWQVSSSFATSFSLKTHTFDDGASQDDAGVITFPDGVGSYNANGAASVSYGGSVSASLVVGGVEQYKITIADPRVVVDSDGEGVLTAVVSARSIAQDPNPAEETTPKRVVVTTFDAAADDWTDGSGRRTLTATPDWTGVLPADSQQATDLGIGAGKPIEGASFGPAFLGQLTSGVRAFFYQSGANQTTKKPATIIAEADPINVTVDPTVTVSGLSVAVQGTGFSGESLVGDAGVYVGIAPSGGLPDVSTPAGLANFPGAQWVPAASIVGGVLSTTVTAPADKLDAGQSYSVYTWQAHKHSTASQDTETPLEIDLTPEPTPSATPTPTPTPSPSETTAPAPSYVMTITRLVTAADTPYGTAAAATATVTTKDGAPVTSGTVELSGYGATQSAQVTNGSVSFALPVDLPVGTHTLTAIYSGEGLNLISTSTTRLTVAKAGTSQKVSVSTKPTSKKKGKAAVTVQGATGVTAPGGTAYVKFTKGKSSKTVKAALSAGQASITVPKLKKGTWKVEVRYDGDVRYASSGYQKVTSLKVKK